MSRKLISLAGLLFTLVLWGCGGTSDGTVEKSGGAGEEIARTVSLGVGEVKQSFAGTTGTPVILLEERHNSRVGQLQHAITLVRLHDKYGLRHIVLEGYLKENPPIDTEWFSKAVKTNTPDARAQVAVQFLRQGEISAAEFMKLVYTDVILLPAETRATYDVGLPTGNGPIDYLNKIAVKDYSWAEEKSKPYESAESVQKLTGDEHLKLAREIKQYAEDNSVSITPQEKQSMERFIEFWEKRMASNTTIAEVTTGITGGAAAKVIAVNIGAFHTDGMRQLLKDANRPYAVIKPLYTAKDQAHPQGENQGDLTDAMYERKNKKISVFSQGLSTIILKEAAQKKKPEPVLAEVFFETEAELYAFVNRITEAVLGPSTTSGPPNKRKPPFGLFAGDFDGNRIKVVPTDIEYFPGKEGGSGSVLIPVVFKTSGSTEWVGGVLGRKKEGGQENVEAILLRSLQDVQSENSTPEQAEDPKGRIQMGDNTFAIVGTNKEAVKKAIQIES